MSGKMLRGEGEVGLSKNGLKEIFLGPVYKSATARIKQQGSRI